MPTVADCFRQHAAAYLQTHDATIPIGHRKVLHAVRRCKTGELGWVKFQCQRCGNEHWTGRSCGNRHCPNCQSYKATAWLEKRTAQLLPTHYFLVTFTVPDELRWVLRGSQRDGYSAIFDAGSGAIRAVASASKYLQGCTLGFFGALHTWGRDPMVYHPHVHFVVPGGGVDRTTGAWKQTPENFFLPHAALARVYKAKCADHLRASGLYDQIPGDAWKKPWTVDIKAVGNGAAALTYLAAYVNRVGLSNKRIVSCDAQGVCYRFTPTGRRQPRERTVTGNEFLRGMLQHTLPPKFQRIRSYGWMSPNSRTTAEEVRWAVLLYLGLTFWLLAQQRPVSQQQPAFRCAECGGPVKTVAVTDGIGQVIHGTLGPCTYHNGLGYRDSG